MRLFVGAVLMVVLCACGSGPSSDGTSDASGPSLEVETAPTPDSPREVRGDTCSEVRAGIDAFNRGAFEETVSRFESAVPLAEEAAEDDPSRLSEDLLEAVEYYAELAPDDYPAAAAGSPEFAKNKQITLRQCASDGPPESPDKPDVKV